MATQKNIALSNLYTELNRFCQNSEYDRAIKTANRILKDSIEDNKAFHCKVVCYIQLSQFDEAIRALDKSPNLSGELLFERAYCLYRLNRVTEACNLLKGIPNPSFRTQELLAQVLYRLEKYDECFETYKSLIKNSEDDFEEERETNLAAVLASLSFEKGKNFKSPPQLREHTYELSYNNACSLLGQKKYPEAITKLKAAEELCRKTLEEEDTPEDEIEEELGIIRTQLGYVLHMQSKADQALKQYNLVLKNKPSDVAVVAVASNNIVAINKDQNVFESKKRMKSCIGESLDPKLTFSQRCSIALNNCLLLLHTNQLDLCKKQLEKIKKEFPSISAQATLIHASLLCREKNTKEATFILKQYATANPEQSTAISFTLVQLLLLQGHVNEACNVLKSLGDVSKSLGVISALVALYLNQEDLESASKVLKEAITWYKKNKSASSALPVLVHESSQFHLKHGDAKEAAALLEEQRKANPKDPKILAQLISAYSQLDPKKAKEVSKSLPSIEEICENVDVDNLETSSWTMGVKYVKKSGPATPAASSGDLILKKKKRKRKGKLPKNYDPNVDPDPERWLPKRERTAFKKRKDRRGAAAVGKGTQGAVSGAAMDNLDITKGAVPTSPRPGQAQATQPSPKGPRQQRPQPAQKKKKKKGGRW